ncbi:MAG: type II toxin-antitoxin system HicB family antitoxin [Burkholderiales bacterium]|nr:type II toxin-antitoxin system HicB family antitoxin [Anaerolineae bacterium]
MRYAIISRDEDGIWLADVPSLPGCHSFGETREEAIENIREAMSFISKTCLKNARNFIRNSSSLNSSLSSERIRAAVLNNRSVRGGKLRSRGDQMCKPA